MSAIPNCPAALPKLSRLAVTPLGFDTPYDTWMTLTGFDPGIDEELLNLGEQSNTRALSAIDTMMRKNKIRVDPSHTSTPVSGEWRELLPWILDDLVVTGTGAVGNPFLFQLGNILSKRYALWDDTQNIFALSEVAIDNATISASQSDPAVKCEWDGVGVNYGANTVTFPSGLTPPLTAPFIFSDSCGAITINGTVVKAGSVSIRFAKNIDKDRFFNCPTLACAVSQSRAVTVSIEMPYGLHASMWQVGSVTSVPVVVQFNYGTSLLKFNMPRVRHQPKAPGANVPSEMMLAWEGTALASTSGNDELDASLIL